MAGMHADLDSVPTSRLAQCLAKLDMTLDVSADALHKIAEARYDPVYGARPPKRANARQIEKSLSKPLLSGRHGPNDTIPVRLADGELLMEDTVKQTAYIEIQTLRRAASRLAVRAGPTPNLPPIQWSTI